MSTKVAANSVSPCHTSRFFNEVIMEKGLWFLVFIGAVVLGALSVLGGFELYNRLVLAEGLRPTIVRAVYYDEVNND